MKLSGSLCTCIKRYKLGGIVWSLSAWLKCNYFNDCDDGDNALIKSPAKHKTNVRNY